MTELNISSEQIERAVSIGLDANSNLALRQEALLFFDNVKYTREAFELFLTVFSQQPRKEANVRFICLQAVEDVLANRIDILDSRLLAICRECMWPYATGDYGIDEPTFILNKAAHVVVLMAKLQYLTEWSSIFADLINAETSSAKPQAVDFFCRVFLCLDDEIANPLISRSASDAQAAAQIKDVMRVQDIEALVKEWQRLLALYHVDTPDIACRILHILGVFAAWIDKRHLFTSDFVNTLYTHLQNPALKLEACFCLTEMVSKGMSPSERVGFINALNVGELLSSMRLDSVEYTVAVAKLVNMLGVRLSESFLDLPTDDSATELKLAILKAEKVLFPFLLQFLGSDNTTVASQVGLYVEYYLKVEKKRQKQVSYTPNVDNWSLLLEILLGKMELPADFEFDSDAEEPTDDENEAMELRKGYKSMVDGIAALESSLYESCVFAFVEQVFAQKKPPFGKLELALYFVFILGEGKPLVSGKETKLSLLLRQVFSKPSTFFTGNGLTSLLYFEIVVRYVVYLDMFPEYCPSVMETFLGDSGLYSSSMRVRIRVMYLFARFLKSCRHRYSAPVHIEQCLERLQQLLYIQVPSEPASTEEKPGYVNKAFLSPLFEAQLYVFESVGLLIDQETVADENKAAYVRTVLNPLLLILQRDLSDSNLVKELQTLNKNGSLLLQMHHAMTACGSLAKGFDFSKSSRQFSEALSDCFQTALKACLFVLEQCSNSEAIREASRYTFQRLIPILGSSIVPYFEPLVASLFAGNSMQEILDLLPSLELLMHKYPKETRPVLDSALKPILDRLFALFNTPVQGTDDTRLLIELKKAFLNLIIYTFANDLDSVLVSERNRDQLLPTILEAVRHLALDNSDCQVQKGAFMVYSRMVECWSIQVDAGERVALKASQEKLNGMTKKETSSMEDLNLKLDNSEKQIPGFDQFIYETIVPTSFEVPLSKEFKLTDGGAFLVISEIVTLHRVIVKRLGTRYFAFLTNIFLPRIGVDMEATRQFVHNLYTLDPRAFRTYLIQFYKKYSQK